MLNRFTLILCFFAPFSATIAQISEGGLPLSWKGEHAALLNAQTVPVVLLQTPDVAQARLEDEQTPGPDRFAVPTPADVEPTASGVWTTLPNGDRVWRCAVQADGAKGLVLIFDQFSLTAGAKFFAYTSDKKHRFGAYTAASCLSGGRFLIGVLPGETAAMELLEPASTAGQSSIHLNRVDYVFDDGDTATPAGTANFGASLPCNVNVNCPAGANWQTEKKGVARILMVFDNGTGWCTGSLIANTSSSATPYFLTAHHCQLIGLSPDFGLWRFDFDYEAPGCTNPAQEPTPKSVLGAQRLAFRAETDFMLLQLEPIPAGYGVYFNGWDRTTSPAASSTFIHHPAGDIKKISVDTSAAISYNQTISWGGVFGTSPANTHWRTIPDIGIFQPGSSGCPLFNPGKRIVGQLHGGQNNNCTILGAYFGRFDLSWGQGSAPDSRLKEWLDPGNTNATTQNGYFQPTPTMYAISGNVQTHWGQPMRGVKVELTGGTSGAAFTDSLGNFTFNNVPAGSNYTVSPTRDSVDLNGVSTYDLLLISRHLLQLESFDSPWKHIAADINRSNSMSTFDIVTARKVILGIDPSFLSNTSWRFFPAFTSFSDPNNPFNSNLPPEKINITNLQANYQNANFKGVKIGDVNNNADPKQ